MSGFEFATTLLFFLLFVFSSFSAGSIFIKLAAKVSGTKKIALNTELFGASILIGIGLLSYLALGLGLLGIFNKASILSMLTLTAVAGVAGIRDHITRPVGFISSLFRSWPKNITVIALLTLAIISLAGLYLAAMQPPHTPDELHYHFPQVREIVQNQRIDLRFGGHPYYGSIPKLMEIAFAEGVVIGGYSLAHAVNFLILLGFLLIVFGIIKKHVNIRAASISVLLLAFFGAFTWNATGGYIDSATACMEIGALLFFIDWLISKSKEGLPISAVLLGLSLAIKYSSVPTALFIAVILIGFRLKKFLSYFSIVFLFCGFWYVKNLISLGNPFYPFYFGHRGINELQYQGILNDLRDFGPKTLQHFIKLTTGFLTTSGFLVFLSIYTAPLILLVKRMRKFSLLLLVYFVLYTLYWFLMATHQTRFWMPGLIVSTLIFATILAEIKEKYLAVAALLVFIFSFIYSKVVSPINYQRLWTNFWNNQLHIPESQYALGKITETEFLLQHFGCQYSVIKYLEDNKLAGKVIDNWSVWFAPSVSFYAEKNTFQAFPFDIKLSASQLSGDLAKNNFKYIYFNPKVKEAFLTSSDPIVKENKALKLSTEEYLLKFSKLLFQDSDCQLYRINF